MLSKNVRSERYLMQKRLPHTLCLRRKEWIKISKCARSRRKVCFAVSVVLAANWNAQAHHVPTYFTYWEFYKKKHCPGVVFPLGGQ